MNKPNDKEDKGETPLDDKEFGALKEKAQKAEEYYDKWLRAHADLDNYKKRALKEKEEFLKYANEDIIYELLTVVDDFERALGSSKKPEDYDVFFQGLSIIFKHLKEIMENRGLIEIKAVGEKFDPSKHEAIEETKTDKYPDHTIIEELQKGYMLNGKVIRPARVKVATKPVTSNS